MTVCKIIIAKINIAIREKSLYKRKFIVIRRYRIVPINVYLIMPQDYDAIIDVRSIQSINFHVLSRD